MKICGYVGLTRLPEDGLPDGGGGGSTRVVPGYSGTDWAAEIGNRDVRMKADHVKTTATTEEVSSHPVEKGHWSQKWRRNKLPRREKPMADWKMTCKSMEQEENGKVLKKAYAARGHESKWEIPDES